MPSDRLSRAPAGGVNPGGDETWVYIDMNGPMRASRPVERASRVEDGRERITGTRMQDQLALPTAGQPAPHPAPPPAPAAPPRTWEEMFPRRAKPKGAPYGFLSVRGELVTTSRDRLLYLARTRAIPSLVWSPEADEMVPPWDVPFLLEAMRGEIAADAWKERRRVIAGGAAAVLLLFAVFPPSLALSWSLGVATVVLVLTCVATHRIEKARRMGPEVFRRDFDSLVDLQAERAEPIVTTAAIGRAIAAAGVAQILFMRASLDVGSVSREAVAAGEWWRLFTAPMLHGGVLHFWMNFGALESLGRTMETRGAKAYVPVVFVAAALAGGVCSIALPPDGLSVGASGGLMGMFGFLAVMAYRREKHLPKGLLRSLLINIAIIGLVGLIAYRFIDNAAHAGGLIAGLLIGVAAVPGGDDEWTEPPVLRRGAWLSQRVIYASAALAILLTLARVFG